MMTKTLLGTAICLALVLGSLYTMNQSNIDRDLVQDPVARGLYDQANALRSIGKSFGEKKSTPHVKNNMDQIESSSRKKI